MENDAGMPDACESPMPVEETPGAVRAMAAIGAGMLAGLLVFPIFTGTVCTTCGATRTVRLEWERREQEIEEAIRARDGGGDVTAEDGAEE